MNELDAQVLGARLNFGYNLKKQIKKNGLTVNGTAEKLNISKSILRKYLNCTVVPEFDRLIRISIFLDCSVDELLWG